MPGCLWPWVDLGGLVGRGGRLLVVFSMVVRVRCLGIGRVEGCEARGGSEGEGGRGKGEGGVNG